MLTVMHICGAFFGLVLFVSGKHILEIAHLYPEVRKWLKVVASVSVGVEINHLGSFKEGNIRKKKSYPKFLNDRCMVWKLL